MRGNRAFWRALHSLAHPVSLGAVLLLLLNDHWMRHTFPSVLTGKLGDFTWLIFAPLIAAVCFAWIIPRRIQRHELIVGWLSFGFIGLWFALAKTVPAVHQLTKTAWEALVGWQGTLRLDPTDLLTLPALLIGWWIWQHADDSPISLRPLAYVALALGVVGTLASDEPFYYSTDPGILSICEQDGRLVATTPAGGIYNLVSGSGDSEENWELTTWTNVFTSDDGGLTWTSRKEENYEPITENCSDPEQNHLIDPLNTNVQYRWQSGERIERSVDNGQTWALEYNLSLLQQDVRKFYNHAASTGFAQGRHYAPSPVSGLIDVQTQNIVLAMSWDGMLVRTSDGEWHWVHVGNYHLADISGMRRAIGTASFEQWMALALGFLVITTAESYMRHRISRHWDWSTILLAIGWAGWVLLSLWLLPEARQSGGEIMWYFIPGLVSFVLLISIAIPLSIGAVWDIARNFRNVWRQIAIVAMSVGLLYLFPYLLWAQGTIPRYATATVFALILAVGGLVAGYRAIRPRLPELEEPDDSASATSDE